MDIKEIFSKVDHTELSVTAVFDDIKQLCDDAVNYKTASVCIAPCYVKAAKEYVNDKMKVCTVIGFPNGYNTTETKVFETKQALDNGADEIDMVINIGMLKEKRYKDIFDEITEIRKACEGKILKVIIETCLLSDKEKIQMCKIVSQTGADFIKTSTGFSKGGATLEDVKLMKASVENGLKIKAAGGIKSLKDAEDLILNGASRLGTSRIVKIVKEGNF